MRQHPSDFSTVRNQRHSPYNLYREWGSFSLISQRWHTPEVFESGSYSLDPAVTDNERIFWPSAKSNALNRMSRTNRTGNRNALRGKTDSCYAMSGTRIAHRNDARYCDSVWYCRLRTVCTSHKVTVSTRSAKSTAIPKSLPTTCTTGV
eukprot:2509110-Rhodomonas_salina.1